MRRVNVALSGALWVIMSAKGQKRTFRDAAVMSALARKADVCSALGQKRTLDASLTGRCDGLRLRLRSTLDLIRVRQVRAADRL